jgi:hypothetical protein
MVTSSQAAKRSRPLRGDVAARLSRDRGSGSAAYLRLDQSGWRALNLLSHPSPLRSNLIRHRPSNWLTTAAAGAGIGVRWHDRVGQLALGPLRS